VHFRGAKDALAAGIGMVHQELSIVPGLSVAENVFLGHQLTNGAGVVRWRAMAREARTHLERLGIGIDPDAETGRLPLGLQQLVELGRVLFSGARIIILDEPTSALSPPEIQRLFAVLRLLKREGTSFIFISHFLEDVLEVSDTVTVFRNSRRIATAPAAEVDKHWLIERMIGQGHEELEEAIEGRVALATTATGPAALEALRLTRKGAFRDLSFAVRPGEVLGVYGFMGSGQLDLAKSLMGKLTPDAGEVRIGGAPVRLTSTARAKRAGVALVAESRRAMLFAEEPV
jgi:ribose transport system ATP-binding protein